MNGVLDLNNFAVLLHQAIVKKGGNVFASPISACAVLAMVQKGAVGKTAEELRNALGSNGDLLTKLISSPPKDCIIANALVSQEGYAMKKDFSDVLEKDFRAQAIIGDFRNERDLVVSKINAWAQEKTNGTISRLLDSLDAETILVLLNAVYFKGNWVQKFDKQNTVQQAFYCKGLETKKKMVEMMHIKNKFFYAETESIQALNLPYEGNEVAMLVLLPSAKDGLQTLESELKSSFIQDIKTIWRKYEVRVSLPKFRLEFSDDLTGPLQNLGIHQLFQWGSDLSGINECGQLKVSEVRQKAVFIIDEEGCEAAAATAMAIKCRKLPIVVDFTADRPFLFVIYDTRTDLILFMGRVEEL